MDKLRIDKWRVRINDVEAKPAKEVKVGDVVAMRSGAAALLFAETLENIAARERVAEHRRLNPEPSAALEHGRPTKRDRRELDKAKQGKNGWGDRWSASLD